MKKIYYKCIFGEFINEKISFDLKWLNKDPKTELGKLYNSLYEKVKQNSRNSFLFVTNNNSIAECNVKLNFSDKFCSYQKNNELTDEDKQYIANELEYCFKNSLISELQRIISNPFYKEIKLAIHIKDKNDEHTLFSAGFGLNDKIKDAELVLDIDTSIKDNLGVKSIKIK